MRKTLGIITAAAGLATLTLAATPATSAELPATDSVYILPCDYEESNGQLYSLDTATGEATPVGDWVNPDLDGPINCAGPGAYNPVNGLGYWLSWGNSEGYLVSIDLTTGVNTLIGEFTLDGEPLYTPIALAIDSDGNAWATSWSVSPDVLYSVDLATAVLTEVGPTGVFSESSNYGLAWDSVTETVYAYNVDGTFYTVNTDTGEFTVLDEGVLDAVVPLAIAFDSAGQVWGIDQDVISAPLTDLDNAEVLEVINPYPAELENEGSIYSESIIIVPGAEPAPTPVPVPAPAPAPAPAPQLAATGSTDSGVAAAGAVGMILLVAGAVIATRRRAAQAK